MKHIASVITTGRIAGAVLLLLTKPLSIPFFAVYFSCCMSDVFDGYIARKTNTTSTFGEILDSIADFILIAVMFIIFVPLLAWEQWMLYWIGIIIILRFVSLIVGGVKYHAFAFLHTYANKATGIVCACFPVLYQLFGLTVTAFMLCGIASLSALEELIITISSKQLNRNVRSLGK